MLSDIFPIESIPYLYDAPNFPVRRWTDYFHDYGQVIVYRSSGSDLDISVDPDNLVYRAPGVRIYPQ